MELPVPSFYQEAMHRWEAIYAARFANLGANVTIIPLVDPALGKVNAAAHATRAFSATGSEQVLTWATAPGLMTTPFNFSMATDQVTKNSARLYGPGLIPCIVPNASNDRATIPDAAYWTNAVTNAFSTIGCVYLTNKANTQIIFAKDDGTDATKQEWTFAFTSTETLFGKVWDQTATASFTRTSDAAVPLLRPIHVCWTSAGSTTAGSDLLYVDGATVASTATASGVFTTMRDTAAVVSVLSDSKGTPTQYFGSPIYGGPFGPTFVDGVQLTASQVLNDYRLWRGAMGLG